MRAGQRVLADNKFYFRYSNVPYSGSCLHLRTGELLDEGRVKPVLAAQKKLMEATFLGAIFHLVCSVQLNLS